MSIEKSLQHEDCKYFNSVKRSSLFAEGRLAKKCLSALLLTVKKYVSSMKFSIFKEHFKEIYQSHPDELKAIHNQLQVQIAERLKEIMLKLFIKHDVSSWLFSLDNTIVDNKNSCNKYNKAVCLPAFNSSNRSSYPTNTIQIKLKNQRMCRNERLGPKQAIKRSKPSTDVERPRQNRSSTTKQAHLKYPTNSIKNKRLSTHPQIHCEKQQLISILSQLRSYNEEKENMIFRVHEDILTCRNKIQDLNKKVMVELDKLHERHVFKQKDRSLAMRPKF